MSAPFESESNSNIFGINPELCNEDTCQQKQYTERRPELLTRAKYCNNLPDMPFDLKSIRYPLYPDRYVPYKPTLLERMYLCDLISEHDLGVEIDVIDIEQYKNNSQLKLHPIDAKLLEEVDDTCYANVSQRSMNHARSVSWLKRSEYISSEQARYQSKKSDKAGQESVRKRITEQPVRMDRKTQMKAIEKTFNDTKISIEKHYSKPGIKPVEVMPVFPDFDLWKYQCAQVIFDNDPAPLNKLPTEQIEIMSQAMMRGLMDESGEQFVAYFLPTDETLKKRREDQTAHIPYDDDYIYEYKMTKEYNWNVKTKTSKGCEENYFFVIRDKIIYYNELETKVRLAKRRCGTSGSTRLMVKHRPPNPAERRSLQRRQSRLEPLQEEEEEDEPKTQEIQENN